MLTVNGATVSHDGTEITQPGTYGASDGITGGTTVTLVAKPASSTVQLSGTQNWSHAFPLVVTPKGPTFTDTNGSVYIPADYGVRYSIDVAGKSITRDGLDYAKPGTYSAADGITPGELVTVTAKSAGSTVILTGTQSWTHTFIKVPDYGLASGDEFNDPNGISTQWKAMTTTAANLSKVQQTVYTPDALSVKDGNLEIRTERHCLSGKDEPSAANVSPNGAVCPSGTRTVYASGRMSTDFIYHAPFTMEVRARMSDGQMKGMHFAAWIRNNQPYCSSAVQSSNLAEVDTMEVFTEHAYTTNTSHITCVAGPQGQNYTDRDGHRLDATIAGQWHTYKMVWNGYSIQYFFDGTPVPLNYYAMTGTETTSETLNLTPERFRQAMNDKPWQLIIDSLVFPSDSNWIGTIDNTKPFPARTDRVDYVRMSPTAEVYPMGGIGAAWSANRWLGSPLDAESDTPTAGGRVQHFTNGSVYWSASTGAHILKGAIRAGYEASADAQQRLGLPTTDEFAISRGGAAQLFSGGQYHWASEAGAHFTLGGVQSYWASAGWQDGPLGFPTGNELAVNGGVSQTFQGGTVFWSAATGAHAVGGAIKNRYADLGYEQGRLGFPTGDELKVSGGASQSFQNGTLFWDARTGRVWAVGGGILGKFASLGYEQGVLGFPTGDEIAVNGGASQTFRNGTIFWDGAAGRGFAVRGGMLQEYASLRYE